MKTKTVFPTDEIAHLWAHQRTEYARNPADNFYFRKKTIYSYGTHFPIACLAEDGQTVIMTTRTYSNTTAKHIHNVRGAVSHLQRIYCKHPEQATLGDHEDNILAFEQEAKGISKYLKSSRKPEIYLEKIKHQRDMFHKYCDFFVINKAKAANDYGLTFLFIESKDGGVRASEQEQKLQEQARKREEARQKRIKRNNIKKDKDQLSKWRNFEGPAVVHFNEIENSFLRINKDSKEIETSKGIKISFEIAHRFYNTFLRALRSGGCRGTCDFGILGYPVRCADQNGLIVGCHIISIEEIESLVVEMGWASPQKAIEACISLTRDIIA